MTRRQSGNSGGARGAHERVRTARGRKVGSTRWLERQLNDPYVHDAKRLGYRSRAAFKLIQIDHQFTLLRPGTRVVDLGAAPGGWTQVAVERVRPTKAGGCVVALDLVPMDPIRGAVLLEGDINEKDILGHILGSLNGKADVVLSDMADRATGHASTDHLRTLALAEAALAVARDVLAPGGAVVLKVLQGSGEPELFHTLRRSFIGMRRFKPKASRADSTELFLVATGYKGEG